MQRECMASAMQVAAGGVLGDNMTILGTIRVDETGAKICGEVTRLTKETLGGGFGPDRKRRLVVSLRDGDVVEFRPHGCRKGKVSMMLKDVYRYALQCEANKRHLAKARERKARKAVLRERAAIKRMEKKLFDK
jgi:hypothetical protein